MTDERQSNRGITEGGALDIHEVQPPHLTEKELKSGEREQPEGSDRHRGEVQKREQ